MEDTSKNPGTAPPKKSVDSGLACLMILARLFELPANPEGLRHQFGRPGKPFEYLLSPVLRYKAESIQER